MTIPENNGQKPTTDISTVIESDDIENEETSETSFLNDPVDVKIEKTSEPSIVDDFSDGETEETLETPIVSDSNDEKNEEIVETCDVSDPDVSETEEKPEPSIIDESEDLEQKNSEKLLVSDSDGIEKEKTSEVAASKVSDKKLIRPTDSNAILNPIAKTIRQKKLRDRLATMEKEAFILQQDALCEEFGLKLTLLQKLYTTIQSKEKSKLKKKPKTNHAVGPDPILETVATHNGLVFNIRRSGISVLVGEDEEKWLCDNVNLDGVYRDEANENWGGIFSFKDIDGVKHVRPIEDFDSNAAGLVKDLRSSGLVIDSPGRNQSTVIQYLIAALNTKGPKVTKYRSVTQPGFPSVAGKTVFNSFVLPRESIKLNSAEDFILTGPSAVKLERHFQQSGTLEDWKSSVGEYAKHSNIIKFSIALALTAPTLPVLDLPTFGVHLIQQSSSGKTTAACANASTFGTGQETGGDIVQWESTSNGVEVIASEHNHLPLVLDEINQARPATLEAVPYKLGNGSGKVRMTADMTLRKVYSWRTAWLSTGEEALQDARTSKGLHSGVKDGEQVRLINIPIRAQYGVFDTLPGEIVNATEQGAKLSADIKNAAAKFYGTAGRAYVKALMSDIETNSRATFVAEYELVFQALKKQFPSLSRTALRILRSLAAVAFVGEKAILYGVLPWTEGDALAAVATCFKLWLASENTREVRIQAALQSIYGVYEKEANIFDQHANNSNAERIAKPVCTIVKTEHSSTERLAVIYTKSELDKRLRESECGFSRLDIIHEAKSRNALIASRESGDFLLRSDKFGFTRGTWVYVFIVPQLSGEDASLNTDAIVHIFKSRS